MDANGEIPMDEEPADNSELLSHQSQARFKFYKALDLTINKDP